MAVAVRVSVERGADGVLGVKLSTDFWEVNVFASSLQIASLRDIRNADWDQGRSMGVGESAGAPVFWSCRGNDVWLMIGHDDQTWHVAVTFPVAVVDEIVSEAEREP